MPEALRKNLSRNESTATVDTLQGLDFSLENAQEERDASRIVERTAELGRLEQQVAHHLGDPDLKGRADHNLVRSLAAGIFALNLTVSEVFPEEKKAEAAYSAEQVETLQKITGMPFQELEAGFTFEMPISAGLEGKYIIHIGQTHEHPGSALWKAITQDKVIAAQAKIERLARGLIDQNDLTCIFSEGLADETLAHRLKEYISKAKAEIDAAIATPITSAGEFFAQEQLYFKHEANLKHRLVLHSLGDKLKEFWTKLNNELKSPSFTPKDDAEARTLRFAADVLQGSAAVQMLTTLGADSNPYAAGIDFKLLNEGHLQNVCPAEDAALNDRAFAAMEETRKARDAYFDIRIAVSEEMRSRPEFKEAMGRRKILMEKEKGGLTETEKTENERLVKILSEMLDLRDKDSRVLEKQEGFYDATAKEKRTTFLEREKEVLSWINTYDLKDIAAGKTLGNVVVLYGRAHDFVEAVKQWNQGDSPHNPIKRGLIKISPRE